MTLLENSPCLSNEKKSAVYLPAATVPLTFFEGKCFNRDGTKLRDRKNNHVISLPSQASSGEIGLIAQNVVQEKKRKHKEFGWSRTCTLSTEVVPFTNFLLFRSELQIIREFLFLFPGVDYHDANPPYTLSSPPKGNTRIAGQTLFSSVQFSSCFSHMLTRSGALEKGSSPQIVLAKWPQTARRRSGKRAALKRLESLHSFLNSDTCCTDSPSSSLILKGEADILNEKCYKQKHDVPKCRLESNSQNNGYIFPSGKDKFYSASTSGNKTSDHGNDLYWPACVTNLTGIFTGSMFAASPSGYKELQSVETWEALEKLTESSHASMQVVVDVLYALDEVTEAHHLSITLDASLPLHPDRFPEVISIWNASFSSHSDMFDASSLSSSSCSFPSVRELRRGYYSSFACREPISVYELLAGPVFQTKTIALLKPSVEVLEYCRQKALFSLKEVWEQLRRGLSTRAPRFFQYTSGPNGLIGPQLSCAHGGKKWEKGKYKVLEKLVKEDSLTKRGTSMLGSLRANIKHLKRLSRSQEQKEHDEKDYQNDSGAAQEGDPIIQLCREGETTGPEDNDREIENTGAVNFQNHHYHNIQMPWMPNLPKGKKETDSFLPIFSVLKESSSCSHVATIEESRVSSTFSLLPLCSYSCSSHHASDYANLHSVCTISSNKHAKDLCSSPLNLQVNSNTKPLTNALILIHGTKSAKDIEIVLYATPGARERVGFSFLTTGRNKLSVGLQKLTGLFLASPPYSFFSLNTALNASYCALSNNFFGKIISVYKEDLHLRRNRCNRSPLRLVSSSSASGAYALPQAEDTSQPMPCNPRESSFGDPLCRTVLEDGKGKRSGKRQTEDAATKAATDEVSTTVIPSFSVSSVKSFSSFSSSIFPPTNMDITFGCCCHALNAPYSRRFGERSSWNSGERDTTTFLLCDNKPSGLYKPYYTQPIASVTMPNNKTNDNTRLRSAWQQESRTHRLRGSSLDGQSVVR